MGKKRVTIYIWLHHHLEDSRLYHLTRARYRRKATELRKVEAQNAQALLLLEQLRAENALSFFTSTSAKDYEKLSAYECGFEPMHSNARIKFDVIYWIIGILYLIFDLELIFIFPFATILHNLQNPIALLVYLIFIIVLTLGFIYEWKKGALKLK